MTDKPVETQETTMPTQDEELERARAYNVWISSFVSNISPAGCWDAACNWMESRAVSPSLESTPQFAIISDGEGAEACIIADQEIHKAVHCFMCCCGRPWTECEADMQSDIRLLDDPDQWSKDESGKPFSVCWPHETGRITIYRLLKAASPATETQPDDHTTEGG